MGHIIFQQIQWLIRSKKLKTVDSSKFIANCTLPKCACCEFGKAYRRPNGASRSSHHQDKEFALEKKHLYPDQHVSTNHFISAVPVRTYSSRGSSKTNFYCRGSIFVDYAKEFIDVRPQFSLSAADTIKTKLQFEKKALLSGVHVLSYHTDNGVFTSAEVMQELLKND